MKHFATAGRGGRLTKWIQPHPEFERPLATGQSLPPRPAKGLTLIAACVWSNLPTNAGRTQEYVIMRDPFFTVKAIVIYILKRQLMR
jgi:hypothetical protein